MYPPLGVMEHLQGATSSLAENHEHVPPQLKTPSSYSSHFKTIFLGPVSKPTFTCQRSHKLTNIIKLHKIFRNTQTNLNIRNIQANKGVYLWTGLDLKPPPTSNPPWGKPNYLPPCRRRWRPTSRRSSRASMVRCMTRMTPLVSAWHRRRSAFSSRSRSTSCSSSPRCRGCSASRCPASWASRAAVGQPTAAYGHETGGQGGR